MEIIQLINLILANINLNWDNRNGLTYRHNTFTEIKIQASFKQVLDFLKIPIDIDLSVERSPLEMAMLLTKNNIISRDTIKFAISVEEEGTFIYDTLVRMQLYATGKILPFDTITIEKVIEDYFDVNLPSAKEKTNKTLTKSKINGKVLMYWVDDIKQGREVQNSMKEFIDHIIWDKKIPFKTYVKITPTKEIKKDFLNFIDMNFKEFEDNGE